ncbi:MAG: hypothetical protein JXR81_05390 [Candidatus Goldbacteria bacterium]|nr:hypothetical protein [Candidatus Goldiibacteriota bacterium]
MASIYKKIILAAVFIFLSIPAFAAPLDNFKRSDIYSGGMFNSASVKTGAILLLDVSEKFNLENESTRRTIIKAAVEEWRNNNKGNACMVSVSGGDLVSELWSVNENGKIQKTEEWGAGAKSESSSDFFLSGNLMGSVGTASINLYAGTYFFNNVMDASVSLNILENSVGLGLYTRGHWFVSQTLDLNAGLQVNNVGNFDNMDLSLILGASNFIGYKTSLDFTCSISTSGRVALGTGITFHQKAGSAAVPFDVTPSANIKTAKSNLKSSYTPAATATPENTVVILPTETMTPTAADTYTPVPTPTQTAVPSPAVQLTAVPKQETEQEMKDRLKKEILEELRKEKGIEQPKEKAKADTEDEKDGFYMEIDTLALARIIEGSHAQKDLDIKMGWGDCGLFGISTWMDFIMYNDEGLDGMFWGVKIAADFYPLWNINPSFSSPAGLYVGPVLGGGYGRFNQYYGPGGGQDDEEGETGEVFGFSVGCELGYRLSLGGFLIDAGAEYAHNVRMYAFDSLDSDDIIYRLQIGWMWSSCGGIK